MKKVNVLIFLAVACMLSTSSSYATSVNAIALFEGRAMLSIDGAKPKIIRAGKTFSGIKLISSNTSEAIILVNGKRETLTLNSSLVLSESLGAKASNAYFDKVQLFVNEEGFFQSEGSIDGKPIEFLVDTGANLVVLNSIQAEKIGLNYKNGKKSQATTASGVASMYLVNVKSMTIGGIEVDNVKTGVIVGSFPTIPLLGMTFLGRLNMERNGDIMTLKRR